MVRIILAGGGGAEDSRPIDELLIKLIPPGEKLLYIPIAWKSGDFKTCYDWFTDTFGALGFSNIEMWTNLEGRKLKDLKDIGAIYLGGGNTFSLLHDLRQSGFYNVLKGYIDSNRIIYGGSAGAIIWGKDIRTASFGRDSDENSVGIKEFSGLNQVRGYSIQCHYMPDQDNELMDFVKHHNVPVIALPERSGLFVENQTITVKGYEPSYRFNKTGKKSFNPGKEVI